MEGEETISQSILRLLKAGKTSKNIISMGYNENTIKRVKRINGLSKSTKRAGMFYTIRILREKSETYYTNELDYGKLNLNYNYEECKTEYNLEGKEPTIYGEGKNDTIKTFSGLVNLH